MSEASLTWYHELKKDPKKYAAYRAKRNAYRKANPSTKGGRGNQDGQRDRRKQSRKAYIQQFLLNNPCCVCNEPDVDCLQFHHRDPSQKDRSPSQMGSSSWIRIKAEIEKCVVLCANCHCKEHARLRRGEQSLIKK